MSLLVGKIFIERKTLPVKVSIVPGEKVKDLFDPLKLKKKDEFNCGEIINGKKALMYDRTKGEASTEFQNLMLKKITREKGKKSSNLVTEEKFSIIFWTEWNWENIEFQLCISSMPIVVVSHDSQKIQGMATITWDNAVEESFVDTESLSWGQVMIFSHKYFFVHEIIFRSNLLFSL